ncbi:MAG: hypothetical protein ACI81T_001969, partial [Bacteroidia bacterium]
EKNRKLEKVILLKTGFQPRRYFYFVGTSGVPPSGCLRYGSLFF